jgi:hypothetical protein
VTTALDRFNAHGFDRYQIALSLVGHGGAPTPHPFARKGYSYVHMSFRNFATQLSRLQPSDRFFTYIIPGRTPVHLYFDLDGDDSVFASFLALDDADFINSFLSHLSTFFQSLDPLI